MWRSAVVERSEVSSPPSGEHLPQASIESCVCSMGFKLSARRGLSTGREAIAT